MPGVDADAEVDVSDPDAVTRDDEEEAAEGDDGDVAVVDVGPIGPNPERMISPRGTVLVPRGTVLVPMSKDPDGPNETGVPDIVTPGPPAERVVPATTRAVGFAVKV